MAQYLQARRSLPFLSETGPDARNGLSLAHNGFRFHGSHSRVNVPGLLLRFPRRRFHARSAFRSAAGLVRPSPATSSLQPVACSRPRFVSSPAISTPLQDFCIPPDQSVQLRQHRLARLPVPPDLLSLPASGPITRCQTRIIVPGPLRSRRLAVPQTSWNLFHYAPGMYLRQHCSVTRFTLFLNFVG